MYGTLERFNQTGKIDNPTPAPAPQPGYAPSMGAPQAPPTPQPQAPQLDPSDYVTGGQLQEWFQAQSQRQQQQYSQQYTTLARQQAALAKAAVRDKHQDVFDRYAPEIETYLAQTQPEWQTFDNLELVVKLVKGNHVDELVDQAVRERGAVNTEPGMRSTGGSTGAGDTTPTEGTLEDPRVPEHWRKRAEARGITMDTVKEFCRDNGITVEQWFKDFERTSLSVSEG
jgi:hypothetical protein